MSYNDPGLAISVISVAVCLAACAVQLIVQQLRIRSLRRELDQARHDAHHDPLTGLANRRALWPALEASLRDPSQPTTAVVIDLDKFKDVNDAAGHAFGDQILTGVASSLADLPVTLAARLGGDEFALIMRGDPEQTGMIIRTVHQVITRTVPPAAGGEPFALTATIGWATAHVGESARAVLHRADLHNRHAKRHNLRTHPDNPGSATRYA